MILRFFLFAVYQTINSQTTNVERFQENRNFQLEKEIETSEDWVLDPVVQVRWDFSTCGKTGMFGPSQEECDEAYTNSNLADNIFVNFGVQVK